MEEMFVVVVRSVHPGTDKVDLFGPFYTEDGAAAFTTELEAKSTKDFVFTTQRVREPAEVLS